MKNPVYKQDTRPGEIARLLHLCGLGLDGEVPDHSTFSKNRHGRFRDSDLLRRLFETVLQRCIEEGLVGGEGFAIDASLIAAEASDRTRVEGTAGLPPDAAGRAVEEYLAVLDDDAFGAATEVMPKFMAPADPAARWTAAHRGPAFFARQRDYRRCRSDDSDPASRGDGSQAHDRALARRLRSRPGQADR